LLASTLLAAQAGAQEGLRIYISADMEGLAGVVSGEQLGPEGFEYQRYREHMTNEVLAAIEGARAGGATDFVVSDSHGDMQNLLIDRLPPEVRVIRGAPRPLSMMEGIQNGRYDGAIFIGYHAGASHATGVQAHTISGGTVFEISVNGTAASEGMINAGVAGEHGVPVILVAGDDAAVEDVVELLGDVERAVVKRAINARSADTLTPRAAQALIRERSEAAVRRIADFEPWVMPGPLTLELTFRQAIRAQLLELLPQVERTARRTIRFEADTMVDIQHFLKFVLTYPG
jgi:D-amino peptidase